MLRIEFVPVFTARGPAFQAAYLRIDKKKLLSGPTGQILATHENYQWLREGYAYTVLRVPSPCRIRFDDESQSYGPFGAVQIQDGCIRSSLGVGPVLAQVDRDSGRWYLYPTDKRHSVVIIEPA
jgi:hypothetical protein